MSESHKRSPVAKWANKWRGGDSVQLRHSAVPPTQIATRRLVLRPLTEADYAAWAEVRARCRSWLVKWEPRPAGAPSLAEDRSSFVGRCAARERERQLGVGFGFGIFVKGRFSGEITLSSIQRGPFQSATIGYWIDEAMAGHGYTPEAVVAVLQLAFEQLRLHRVEIAIIPRNSASRRVVDKLSIRMEGMAERYLEIDGAWEDHNRYGITSEEWQMRGADLVAAWTSAEPQAESALER